MSERRPPNPRTKIRHLAAFTAALLLGAGSVPAFAQPKPAPDRTDLALEPLLVGEFALSDGDLVKASTQYLEAAKRTNDPVVAENAFRFALLAQKDDVARQSLDIWQKNLSPKSDSTALIGAQAAMALRERKNAEAIAKFAQLLQKNTEPATKLMVVNLATASVDEAQAKDVLGQLINGNAVPSTLDSWIAIGGLAQALNDTALTEAAISQLVARFPNEPKVALLQAAREREAGNVAKAKTILQGLTANAASDNDIRAAIAGEYQQMGEHDAAAKVLSLGPQSTMTYTLRAFSLAQAENETELTQLYRELERKASDPDPEQRILIAQIAQHLKRWEDALRWYRSVPGSDAKWSAQLSAIAVLYELKRPNEWREELKKLQTDQSVPDETRRDAFLLEANLMQRDKNLQGETDAFNKALAAFPDSSDVLYARALAWERRDEVERAIAELRKILVIEPNNVDALNALGYTLADRTKRYDEALLLINRARAARPNNAAIIDSYGWVLFKMGKPEEALVQLRQAANLQKDPEILAHVAEVLLKLGDREGAVKAYEQGRKLDSEGDNRALLHVESLLKGAA